MRRAASKIFIRMEYPVHRSRNFRDKGAREKGENKKEWYEEWTHLNKVRRSGLGHLISGDGRWDSLFKLNVTEAECLQPPRARGLSTFHFYLSDVLSRVNFPSILFEVENSRIFVLLIMEEERRICWNWSRWISDGDIIFLKYIRIYIIDRDEENFIIFFNIISIGSNY